MQRFYGATPQDWEALTFGDRQALLQMIPVLQAEEAQLAKVVSMYPHLDTSARRRVDRALGGSRSARPTAAADADTLFSDLGEVR